MCWYPVNAYHLTFPRPRAQRAVGGLTSRATPWPQSAADRLDLPLIPLRLSAARRSSPLVGDLRRSDHASFWDNGAPGIMLTDSSESEMCPEVNRAPGGASTSPTRSANH